MGGTAEGVECGVAACSECMGDAYSTLRRFGHVVKMKEC